MDDGITDLPPITPSKGVEGEQSLGKGLQGSPDKPFVLNKKTQPTGAPMSPSPIDVARDHRNDRVTTQDVVQRLDRGQQQWNQAQVDLEKKRDQLTKEHYDALSTVMKTTNRDIRTVAMNTGQTDYVPAPIDQKAPFVSAVKWLTQSQDVMGNALNYVSSKGDSVDPGALLRVQYAMNRAQQRAELFSSIIGSSVSGIKTLMSTQLG